MWVCGSLSTLCHDLKKTDRQRQTDIHTEREGERQTDIQRERGFGSEGFSKII